MRRTTAPVLTAALCAALGSTLTLTACGDGLGPHDPAADTENTFPTLTGADGNSVTLTSPETELLYGDAATVASTDRKQRLLAWTLRVDAPTQVQPADVVLPDPADFDGVDHFLCHRVSLTFLGATGEPGSDSDADTDADTGADQDDGSTAASATASGSASATTLGSVRAASLDKTVPPQLSPAASDGSDAVDLNIGVEAARSADENCGVPDAEMLPLAEGDLSIGRTYTRAVIAAVPADDTPTPAGVRFDYTPGIPGASDDAQHPSSVYWGEEDDKK